MQKEKESLHNKEERKINIRWIYHITLQTTGEDD